MTIIENDHGFLFNTGSEDIQLNIEGFGGKANAEYRNTAFNIRVHPSLMFFIAKRFRVFRNQQEIGSLKQKYWSGNYKINLQQAGQEKQYLLRTGRKRYRLFDNGGIHLFTITDDFKVTKFKSEYELIIEKPLSDEALFIELVLCSLFIIAHQSDNTFTGELQL